MKPIKVIIDTDPGVDDTTALIYALHDKKIDIKLLTTVRGNVSIDIVTHNLLFILDLFNKDIPVAVGQKDTFGGRDTADASYIHSKTGLGGFTPPKRVKHSPIKESAVEAMYRVINENAGDIDLIALGPQTNVASLIKAHPDVKKKIRRIICEGPSPYGALGMPTHISFNARTDPEALNEVVKSKIPFIVIPSSIGRNYGHFTEKQVNDLDKYGDVGRFLRRIYSQTYWEPGFPDKRIATNDTLALIYLTHPSIFQVFNTNISVNLDDAPGKVLADFNKDGKCQMVVEINRRRYQRLLFKRLKQLSNLELNVNLY